MKTFLKFLVFLFLACSSSKENQYNKVDCTFNDKISENEKVLDIKLFKEELYSQGDFTLTDNIYILDNISYNSNGFNKRILNKKSHLVKLRNYDTLTRKINYSTNYYNKGNFNIGNEYLYNEKGEIIKTIDHNQYDKFPVCYKEIINSTIKKAGKDFYFQGLERDSIENNNAKIFFWKVYFQDSITIAPTLRHKFFRIDAKTNKTLEEKTF